MGEGFSNTDCAKPWRTEIIGCDNPFDPTNRMNYEENNDCMLLLGPPFIEGAYKTAVLQIYLYPKSLYDEYLEYEQGDKAIQYGSTDSRYHKTLYEMIVMGPDESILTGKMYDGFIDDGQHFVYVMISIPAEVPSGTIKYLPYFFNSFRFNPSFVSQVERCGLKETAADRDSCYIELVYRSGDSAICDMISDQSMVWMDYGVDNKINRLGCLYLIGMRKKDPSVCELVKDNPNIYTQCKDNLN